MAPDLQKPTRSHDVFISYSRKDKEFARRLEKALKDYRPPKDLKVPQRNLDVFRDEEDLREVEYNQAIAEHLKGSTKLIVLCSPNAHKSRYVNDEIKRFADANGGGNIIPLLVGGIPNNEATPEQEGDKAFPQELCIALEMPLAADYRTFDTRKSKISRGIFRGPWYSILANIYGISRNEVEQREQKRRNRRRRITIAIVSSVILVLTAALIVALISRDEAIRQRQISISRQLAAQARNHIDDQPDLALLLAVEACRTVDTVEARGSLMDVLEQTSRVITYLRGHTAAVGCVAFSPDGKILASGGDDGTVRLWNKQTGQQIGAPLRVDQKVTSVAFSADGHLLASGGADHSVHLWDVVSHQPIGPPLSGHSDTILSVVFSPDGKTFASSSASECLLWDLSTKPLTGKLLSEKEGSGGKLAFSQDGRLLAIGSGQDVRLWKALDGVPAAEPLRTNGSWEKCLSFSDDGKMLAAADDFGLSLWSLDAEIPADKPIRANIEFARCVAFKPGGKIIAVGGNDGYLRFWDAETGESTGRPFSGHTAAICDLAFSPDGEMLASASEDGTVILWKVQPNTPLRQSVGELAGYIVNASFNGDDKILACGTDSGEIVLWDFPYGLANGPKSIPNKRRLVCLAFRSGSEILESYHQDDSLQLWDTRTMQLAAKPFTGLGGNEEMTVFSANGTRLASCIGEKLVVWDTQSGHSIGAPIKVPALSLTNLAFNNDGTKLAAWTSTLDNGPGEIYLWNLTVDPAPIETLSGHREEVLNVAFSPDSKTLASCSLDETIRFWDMESGRQKGPVLADVHRVTEVAFSPDGKILASSSILPFSHAPSVLQLWDVLTGKPIGQPRAIGSHGSLTRAPFNHSGTLLVTTDVPAGAQPGGKAALTLWDIDVKSWQERACSIANRNLSRREWLYYLENQTYHKTNLNLPEPLIIAHPKRIIAEENF